MRLLSRDHTGAGAPRKRSAYCGEGLRRSDAGRMVPDITSGLINSTFLSANQALAQVQSGTIRIIGAISDGRSKYFPDAPTLAEQGFADAQVTPWFGVVVPAGTPQPVVDRISEALEKALATGDVQQRLDTAGCEPKSAPLKQF